MTTNDASTARGLLDVPETSTVVLASSRGAASGVASLDPAGKVPSAQLPALAITDTFPVATQAEMLALSAEVGDVAIRSDGAGSFILRQEPASVLSNWSQLSSVQSVSSVDGRTGTIDLSDRYSPAGAVRHRGAGVVLPSSPIEGDEYRHTGLGCTIRYTDSAWRQTDLTFASNTAARAAIATNYGPLLYDGFLVWQADTDKLWAWDTVSWDWILTSSSGGGPRLETYTLTHTAPSLADKWAISTPQPNIRNNPAVGVIDGKIYVAGGSVSSYLTTLEVYDPLTNSWTAKASMANARSGMSAVVGGKLYVIGGVTTGGAVSAAVEMYDPATNTWTNKASLSFGRAYSAVGVIDGKIYVAGGYDGTSAISFMTMYDPAADTWTAKTSLPAARQGAGFGVIDGKFYVAGGYTGSAATSANTMYDPATNTWTAKANITTARYYVSSAVAAGKLYVIGGTNGSNGTWHESYDPVANTWTNKANTMAIRPNVAATTLANRIYLIGTDSSASAVFEYYAVTTTQVLPFLTLSAPATIASTSGGATLINTTTSSRGLVVAGLAGHQISAEGSAIDTKISSNIVVVLNTTDGTAPVGSVAIAATEKGVANGVATLGADSKLTASQIPIGSNGPRTATYPLTYSVNSAASNRWTSTNSASLNRSYATLGVIDGKIYAASGSNASGVTATLEMYDPTTNVWTAKASMSVARYGASAAVVGGKLYVIGGYAGSSPVATVEMYDPTTNTWTTKTSMPAARYLGVAGAIDGKIYYVSGHDGVNGAVTTVYMYDPTTNAWTARTAIPIGRFAAAGGVIDGKLYVAGGNNGGARNELTSYDPVTNAWTALTALPTARFYTAAATSAGKLYVMGGSNATTSVTTNEMYDPVTNAWTSKAALLGVRDNVGGVGLGNNIYLIGGNASGVGFFDTYFVASYQISPFLTLSSPATVSSTASNITLVNTTTSVRGLIISGLAGQQISAEGSYVEGQVGNNITVILDATEATAPVGVTAIAATEKGAPNGLATLGADSKLTASQMPTIVTSGSTTTATLRTTNSTFFNQSTQFVDSELVQNVVVGKYLLVVRALFQNATNNSAITFYGRLDGTASLSSGTRLAHATTQTQTSGTERTANYTLGDIFILGVSTLFQHPSSCSVGEAFCYVDVTAAGTLTIKYSTSQSGLSGVMLPGTTMMLTKLT